MKNKLKSIFKNKNIKRDAKILVVGLGNGDILPDSLGEFVVRKLDKKLIGKRLFTLCPGIYARTGIDSFDVVRIIVKELKVNAVILIDSLAREVKNIEDISNLCEVQIGDCGIIPGSAVDDSMREINEGTLGVPCIAIGVPLIIKINGRFFASKDVHAHIEKFAKKIADAINFNVE